jgi:uncharacterized RDD family membrane protein YckC
VEYEDRRTISTPEGVDLEIPLAGLGSRFIGLLIDTIVQFIVIGVAIGAMFAIGSTTAAIIISAAAVLLTIGYDVIFEVAAGGRTPGKRIAGIRVVMDGGRPIGLRASLIRNFIRLFEGFATSYIPAMVSILATRSNQRLGDLAAGTLVIRDRRAALAPSYVPPPLASFSSLDATAITGEELAIVRSFLARRESLVPHARQALAADLAGRLRPRVAGVRQGLADEPFLEQVAAAKSAR